MSDYNFYHDIPSDEEDSGVDIDTKARKRNKNRRVEWQLAERDPYYQTTQIGKGRWTV